MRDRRRPHWMWTETTTTTTPAPTTDPKTEALENIAYDCASLDDAQKLAREALRSETRYNSDQK